MARFLATGMAISSWGLRTRRNLYNNIELSLVALLLVGEEALSLTFLGYLFVFALVVLTFLAMSHLPVATATPRVALPGRRAILRMGTAVTTAILVLGVAVYLALPQNHTVSSAGPLPSRLDLTSGWPATPTDLSGGDWAPWAQFLPSRAQELRLGPGEGDSGPSELPKYTDLGYAGAQGGDGVMSVRSPLASFWRGFTLDVYDGQGWLAATSEVRLALDEGGRLRFLEAPRVFPTSRAYVQTYYLKVPQPNAVFTAYAPGWIALGAGGATGRLQEAQDNLEFLRQADTYRVLSPIPGVTPDLLRTDRVDTSDEAYLATPRVPERVHELTQRIISGAGTDYDKAARIERFLLENYPYDLRVAPYPKGEDAVDRFLFVDQAGYCSQFATAMAVMGRLAGLPTRVAVGYLPGKYNSLTGVHTVRTQDSHAWVEVRFERFGWVPFDPTPGPNSPWALGAGSSYLTLGIQQTLRNTIGGFVIDAPAATLSGLGSVVGGMPTMANVVLFIGVIASLLALLLRWMLRHRRAGTGGGKPYTTLPGREREEMRLVYRRAVRLLRKRELPPRAAHQSLNEYEVVASAVHPEVRHTLQQLTEWVAAAAYDPAPFPEAIPEQARGLLRDLQLRDGSSTP